MKGTLAIQTREGHTTIEYDTEQAGTNGPLDPAKAEAEFEKMVARGAFAFAEGPTLEREQIRRGGFDPETQSKVVIAPQIAGGR